ncbi:major facilitator superfamily transporter [Grosmannia clavigera kw1407]|uniref:Major facilitator superfamily transporter n=1 Tax=Grosmannia clavigera (strain kw1407 / UAMH 11150) TaxID=655863 RepID=F0XIR4_GROCL|nr:major facilitator superfamily transporter [Grosmannia clavigera kw1407]EFX02301.1 major facilitator superfamily transporter [Grosmannia clavigera kw1407]
MSYLAQPAVSRGDVKSAQHGVVALDETVIGRRVREVGQDAVLQIEHEEGCTGHGRHMCVWAPDAGCKMSTGTNGGADPDESYKSLHRSWLAMAGDDSLMEKGAAAEPVSAREGPTTEAAEARENVEPSPHSVFPPWQRAACVYMASLAAFTSPVSSSIYYPAMQTIAADLHVSLTKISLSITTYMILQGVAPTLTGGFSDRVGRRPAYMLCFGLFIAANIGLARQTDYAALLVLRALQSAGSSGTVALSSATVADVATRQQRGRYIGLAALGSSMGPALGPLIGGLLDHFLGWRAIFWFLAVLGGVLLLAILTCMPETCRNVVGNGAVPPQPWNRPLLVVLRDHRRKRSMMTKQEPTPTIASLAHKKRPGLLSTIPILLDRESLLTLFYSGLLYAGYYVILTGLPRQLAATYHYNSIQVGLCYLPLGLGPMLCRPFIGRLMDANFRRHARAAGVDSFADDRQLSIDNIPVELARLQLSLVVVYGLCAVIIPYGWVMNLRHPPLAAVLVLLFIVGVLLSAAFQPLTALIVDINPRSPAAATAAHQFVRCLLGAAGVATVNPMLDSLGRGWTTTLIALLWAVMSVCWWIVILKGPKWRREKKEKKEREAEEAAKVASSSRLQAIRPSRPLDL